MARPTTQPALDHPQPPLRLTLRSTAREVIGDRLNRVVFAISAALFTLLYTLLLPYAYTQRLSFANWDYLSARYLAFSLAFGVGIGWLVAIQLYATRLLLAGRTVEEGSGRSGFVAMLGGVVAVLPSLLCCSPIVPSLVGVLGLSAVAKVQTTGQIQHFFASEENLLLGSGLALLLLSSLWSLRKVARATCLSGSCCVEEGG